MKAIKGLLGRVVKDEQGGEVLEYALIAGLIVVAAIAVFLLDLLIRRVRLFDRKFLPRRSLPPPPPRAA